MAYRADLRTANQVWPVGPALERFEDLLSVTIAVDGPPRKVVTHAFGPRVNIVPYELDHDDEIAACFPPGDVGFAIKHRRTEFRVLDANMLDPTQFTGAQAVPKEFKQHLKFQDVHVAAILGTRTPAGQRCVVAISNPEWYPKETFYERAYPMVFVRPVFPEWVGSRRAAFLSNLRAMLVCFNLVTHAPDEYDEQPLAATSPQDVRELVMMMLRALAGDAAGSEFFAAAANQVYCGELVHLAASAALRWPLNRTHCEPLVGAATWAKFQDFVDAHNAGTPVEAVRDRANLEDLLQVQLALAPDDLAPIHHYAPAEERAGVQEALAFPPMTLFDIVEHFVKVHWPRHTLGEGLATEQAHVVEQLIVAVRAWLRARLGRLTPEQLAAVDQLVADLSRTVGTTYASYAELESALGAVRDRAQRLMRGVGLEHLSTPPSMYHLIAQGAYGRGGVLGIEYVGHGLHRSLVKHSSD